MTGRKWNENKEIEPRLSLEKAEEILRNVYRAAGAAPPENCSEILRRGSEKTFKKRMMPELQICNKMRIL